MSAQGAKAFYERVASDKEFRARLEAAATPEEKRQIVTEAGYDLSRDDLPTIREVAGVSELSEEDLEKVAGGAANAPGLPGLGGLLGGGAGAAAHLG